MINNLPKCSLIQLQKITDQSGALGIIESEIDVPFEIKRIYFLYDLRSQSERGFHAHKKLKQCLIAISGSFDVILNTGYEEKKFFLNRPDEGLLISPLIWRSLKNFSAGAVCLVLASERYSEDDYIRNFSDYKKYISTE